MLLQRGPQEETKEQKRSCHFGVLVNEYDNHTRPSFPTHTLIPSRPCNRSQQPDQNSSNKTAVLTNATVHNCTDNSALGILGRPLSTPHHHVSLMPMKVGISSDGASKPSRLLKGAVKSHTLSVEATSW